MGGQRRRFGLHAGYDTLGQFAQQWKLRLRAKEAALKEDANVKLRRLLLYDKSLDCADFAIGDSVLFYEAQNRRSSSRWRGPADFLDIDETGATGTLQSQTFKVARYCARKGLDEKDVHEDDWQTTSQRGDPRTSSPSVCPDMAQVPVDEVDRSVDLVDPEQDARHGGPSTGLTRESPMASPHLMPVPDMASPRLIPAPDSPPF